jgi:malate dehydrogenase (oxaloacetate-decarboxylating)
MTIDERALAMHKKLQGKVGTEVKSPISNREDLSLAYTPGVGAVSKNIHSYPESVWELTSKANTIAIVTDGTAVLGLGDIGPEAALPVMEGKAVLFKEFADINAVPICLNTKDPGEIIKIVQAIAPGFGGINLEDISAPRCFEIEEKLKDSLNIPLMHDDQHGTAVVVLAGIINALKLVQKKMSEVKIVISGKGAAGSAVAKILTAQGATNITVADRQGLVGKTGTLTDGIRGADIFIGVSAPNIVTAEMVATMNKDSIVFALANPVPEIMPDEAKKGGAKIIATGRSDFPNQINNVLAFPGIFKGAMQARATKITEKMKLAAANALASYQQNLDDGHIIPDILDKRVTIAVAEAVETIVRS